MVASLRMQPLLAGDPVPFALTPKMTNERSLEAAVKYASEFLNKAVKPVLVGGVKMRWPGKAQDAFLKLSEAGRAVASSSYWSEGSVIQPMLVAFPICTVK